MTFKEEIIAGLEDEVERISLGIETLLPSIIKKGN